MPSDFGFVCVVLAVVVVGFVDVAFDRFPNIDEGPELCVPSVSEQISPNVVEGVVLGGFDSKRELPTR